MKEDPSQNNNNDKTCSERFKNMLHDFDEVVAFCEKEADKKNIVFFGSAMICSAKDAQEKMLAVEKQFEKSKKRTEEQWAALDHASNAVYMSRYYHAAEELAYKLAKWITEKEEKNKYLICTGGGPGIMEAANKGSHRAGLPSIGLRVHNLLEQADNPYIDPDLKFRFHYFFFRKFCFLYFAKVIITFPGGVGTLDEICEFLNLVRTGRIKNPTPIILFGSEYWKHLINFEVMLRFDTVGEKNLDCIHYFDDVNETFNFITTHLDKHN